MPVPTGDATNAAERTHAAPVPFMRRAGRALIAPTAATRLTEVLLPQQVLGIMGPETIAPGALFMVSDDAPTKTILGAGAGVFAVSQMVESRGVYLPEGARTPEVVAERWSEIADANDANPLETAFEQTSKYAALAARELGLHLES